MSFSFGFQKSESKKEKTRNQRTIDHGMSHALYHANHGMHHAFIQL